MANSIVVDDRNIAPRRGYRSGKWQYRAKTWIGRFLVVAVVAGSWQLSAAQGWVDQTLTGKPTLIAKAFWSQILDPVTYSALSLTLKETVIGWVLGSAAGIMSGLALAKAPMARDIFDPFITGLNSLPRIALAPLFILWFGLGPTSKIALSISLVYFVLLLATLGAVANVAPDLVRLARILGFNRYQIYLKVDLPWSISGIFGGLQLGLVVSFLGAVTGEILGAKAGMGVILMTYANLIKTNEVMATLLILGIAASALSLSMRGLEKRMVRHRDRGHASSK